MRRTILILLTFHFSLLTSVAQQWTMQQCMQYAVEHNHEVKQSELELDNYKATKTGAIGNFLPSVDAGIGAQYNFGRAIDPETNLYTDVSTFYNGYSLEASLPVFDGFSRLHALKAAKASELMGHHALRQRQDQTALDVLRAYADVAYYEGLVTMADEKVKETEQLLRQTQVLEEVGRKSAADVAQVESQKAEADYELLRQQNLYASALLELKKTMAFPLNDSLSIHEWRQARASLLPTLSLNAGLNTTYNKTLHSENAASFSNQLKNNMGEFVGATLSIPLFNRLQSITNIRKAKNKYKIAQETYAQKQLELEKLSREAWQDRLAYQMQTIQMEKKVEADSLSYQQATLLQCQLMAMVKEQLVRYYKGETIWTE